MTSQRRRASSEATRRIPLAGDPRGKARLEPGIKAEGTSVGEPATYMLDRKGEVMFALP
tara:strand:- start:1142 stop:1318 length:177 start_codon:yes stop_codon:yes gene_type:complete